MATASLRAAEDSESRKKEECSVANQLTFKRIVQTAPPTTCARFLLLKTYSFFFFFSFLLFCVRVFLKHTS